MGAPTRSAILSKQVKEPFCMSTQPMSRGPGRPRKNPDPEPETREAKDKPTFPPDERVGQPVADSRWTEISFDDGQSYRIEEGVIVERIR